MSSKEPLKTTTLIGWMWKHSDMQLPVTEGRVTELRLLLNIRTWEFTNRLVNGLPVTNADVPMLAGTISEGLAREFIVFCQIYSKLPTIQSIVAAPDVVAVPTEPSILFALTGAIGNFANEDTITSLMVFINRLPIEFQVVTLRDIVRRKKELLQNPAVLKWISQQATELF